MSQEGPSHANIFIFSSCESPKLFRTDPLPVSALIGVTGRASVTECWSCYYPKARGRGRGISISMFLFICVVSIQKVGCLEDRLCGKVDGKQTDAAALSGTRTKADWFRRARVRGLEPHNDPSFIKPPTLPLLTRHHACLMRSVDRCGLKVCMKSQEIYSLYIYLLLLLVEDTVEPDRELDNRCVCVCVCVNTMHL